MIVAGLGIGLLPPDAVRADIADGTLWPLGPADQAIGADVCLVHQTQLTSADRRFIDLFREILPLFQNR